MLAYFGTTEVWILAGLASGIVPLVAAIAALIDLSRRTFSDATTKLLWVAVIVLAPLLGTLAYFLLGRKGGSAPLA